MKKYVKLIENHMQDKRHIAITGGRGSGKTTLLGEIREKLGMMDSVPGLVTWANPGKAVYARELGSTDFVKVGEFDPNSLTEENKMKAVSDGFDIYGVSILDKLINSDSEWITIDEIGYLEGTSPLFLKKLDELFDKKRVIAVVRKQDIKHINDILSRDDTFVIDLDCIS